MIRDSYGYIRKHTERYLSIYISIPSVTFRYGQTPSDTHLLRSLAYKTAQCDVYKQPLFIDKVKSH